MTGKGKPLQSIRFSNPRGIPEKTTLTLSFTKPRLIYTNQADRKSQVISLKTDSGFKKIFVLGSEIDLARESQIRVGKGLVMDWHDVSGVVLAAAKAITQVDKLETGLTVIDCIIQAHGGVMSAVEGKYGSWAESTGSVVSGGIGLFEGLKEKSDTLGLIFLIPQLKRLVYDHFAGLPATIRLVEDGMRAIGYIPLDEARSTGSFPIWFNPSDKKLALIDPAGLVHPVKPPPNLHISWGFLRSRKPGQRQSPCSLK